MWWSRGLNHQIRKSCSSSWATVALSLNVTMYVYSCVCDFIICVSCMFGNTPVHDCVTHTDTKTYLNKLTPTARCGVTCSYLSLFETSLVTYLRVKLLFLLWRTVKNNSDENTYTHSYCMFTHTRAQRTHACSESKIGIETHKQKILILANIEMLFIPQYWPQWFPKQPPHTHTHMSYCRYTCIHS